MRDRLSFGARPSMLVSTELQVLFAVLVIVSAVFDATALCAAFAGLLVISIISRLWGEHSLDGVSLECRSSAPAVFPGDRTELHFRLRNSKFLPLLWLELLQPL